MKVAMIGHVGAADDFMHPVEAATNFSESCLFHYSGRDPNGRLLGGLIRVANRPNEGYAEATVLAWLPDGSALFNFERPAISGNEHWRVAGWNLEVLEAGGRRFRTRYHGTAVHLAEPGLMLDPKVGFKQPRVEVSVDLHHAGKGPVTELKHHRPLDAPEHSERRGTGGLHQFMQCAGTIAVAGQAPYVIEGYGWRDHNWGPRNWQGFTDHEFLVGNVSDEEGFCLYSTTDGCGFAFHRGLETILEISALQIETEFAADGLEPLRLRAAFTLENGERHVLTGAKQAYMPLRHRREDRVTNIGYSLWEYSLDGRPAIGLGEFLRQRRIPG